MSAVLAHTNTLPLSAENQAVLHQWTNQLDSTRLNFAAYRTVLQQVQENPVFPLTVSLLDTLYDYARNQ